MNHPNTAYLTEVEYPVTYIRELAPAWLNYVAALTGYAVVPTDRPFTYMELGCGPAGSTIRHAADYPNGTFLACDLNPAHIKRARSLAARAQVTNLRLHAMPFDGLFGLDLPPFNFIVMHGVYSWVDAEVRATLRRFLARYLAPQGIAYVSYNCMPGWSAELALHRLFGELAADQPAAAAPGVASARLEALKFAELAHFAANPEAGRAVEVLSTQDPRYLAHEYLNGAWDALYSVDVIDQMRAIELTYGGSAVLAENHPELTLSAAAQAALAALPSARQRAFAADFAVNRRVRRDVFMRASPGQPDAVEQRVWIAPARTKISSRVQTPRGVFSFDADFIDRLQRTLPFPVQIGPLVDALAANRQAHRHALLRNVLYLIAGGELRPVAPGGSP